jgi:copper oxidase (laccase) domain-containing protein
VIGEAVRHLGEPVAAVVLGPVIGPCCYEFGADDVAAIARSLGLPTDVVTGRTAWGTTSLDVPGIVAAVADSYAAPLFRLGGCTGCTYPGFSHRRRHDEGRHVVAAWQVAS